MEQTIAVYGGSFNPPGAHHRLIVEELLRHFDHVVIVPCGPRPDKPSTEGVEPVHRAAMADIAFKGLDRVEVDLFDLEEATFTRTLELDRRYAARGRLFHVVDGDLIAGGAEGQSDIQRNWKHGEALWQRLHFAVIRRPGKEFAPADRPPHHHVVSVQCEGSSFALREKLFHGEPIDELVTVDVGQYIARHGLYHDAMRSRAVRFSVGEPRLLIVADQWNANAREWAARFERFSRPDDPNCVLAIGGDGTMLRAIQEHWRLRVPFFGINAGHLGFLLNEPAQTLDGAFLSGELVARQMPLLYVEMQAPDGTWTNGLVFNDTWLERATGQSAWVEILIDGQPRLPKLVCDGVLLSTAAGSTAYARSMGATPLLANTPAWLLVGSNVMPPPNWKSALLSLDSQVEIRSLDPAKRKLRGYLYGTPPIEIVAMRARVSRIAAVELTFLPSHDITEKIARVQFPPGGAS